ncbi:MAG: epimerase [Betaproteobacteria bacterium]|nr:epimerase [Betaproteobacteria bacterium]
MQGPAMDHSEKTALILGANGRFGRAAVSAFAAAGWKVLAQARRQPNVPLPEGTIHLATSLAATGELADRAAGASVVVYAVNPRYTDWREQALPLLRLGMDLAQHLDALLMLPGNVYNFGAGMPPVLDEHTPEHPTTVKGRIRCDLEAALAHRAPAGLRSVVIRAGDFFGCGRGSWFDLVITQSLAHGKLIYPGPQDVPHAWAYLPDLARAFVAVAEQGDRQGFSRLQFTGHTLTGAQLLDAIETAATDRGIQPARGFKRGAMPWGILRLGGLVVPMWREVTEMAYLWRVPHALDGRALFRCVGPLQETPFPVAMRQTLIDLALVPGSEATADIP